MSDLTSVSSQLAADRGELAKALAALARAVGTVRTFVHDNKDMVETDVRRLTRLTGVLARHQKDLNTLARIGALGLDNLTIGLRQQDQHPWVPPAGRRPTAPTSATCSATSCTTPGVPAEGERGNNDLRAAQDDRRAVLGADRCRPVAEPEPAGPAEVRRHGPATTPRRPAERPEGGERVMSRSARSGLPGAPSPPRCSCWLPPCRDRLQVRRRLRPAPARATRSTRTTASRSPPTSPTPSTWCRAPRCWPTTCRRTGPRGRARRLARQGEVPGPQGHQAARERPDRRTPDQPAGREVHRPGRARDRDGERQAALRGRRHPARPAPAATRRSRRCWAPSRCC